MLYITCQLELVSAHLLRYLLRCVLVVLEAPTTIWLAPFSAFLRITWSPLGHGRYPEPYFTPATSERSLSITLLGVGSIRVFSLHEHLDDNCHDKLEWLSSFAIHSPTHDNQT